MTSDGPASPGAVEPIGRPFWAPSRPELNLPFSFLNWLDPMPSSLIDSISSLVGLLDLEK